MDANLWRRKLNKKGFSLIELLITILIIAILLSISIPTYSSYKKKAYYADLLAYSKILQIAIADYLIWDDPVLSEKEYVKYELYNFPIYRASEDIYVDVYIKSYDDMAIYMKHRYLDGWYAVYNLDDEIKKEE